MVLEHLSRDPRDETRRVDHDEVGAELLGLLVQRGDASDDRQQVSLGGRRADERQSVGIREGVGYAIEVRPTRQIAAAPLFLRNGLALAYRDGRCVGFCRNERVGREAEIGVLGVVPEARGNVGQNGTDWNNVSDQPATTRDAPESWLKPPISRMAEFSSWSSD